MSAEVMLVSGRTGRTVYARVHPNEDLVQAVEKICLSEGLAHCFLRAGLGSLTDACVAFSSGHIKVVRGPAVEVIGMSGMVEADADGTPVAVLHGVLAEPNGAISGGRFVSGHNPVCVTFELVLEEWLPDGARSCHPGETELADTVLARTVAAGEAQAARMGAARMEAERMGGERMGNWET